VRITLVQLLRVDPPAQVINAFRDVQTAKADKEKEINEAQSFSNDVIPRARGEASKMKEDAEAHAQKVVANAQGEAGRFLSVYRQYAKSKEVTRKRIYLETMEELYKNMDKVIIDGQASKSGVVPYLPLNDKQRVK
jgi:membrane protease subunit HflK